MKYSSIFVGLLVLLLLTSCGILSKRPARHPSSDGPKSAYQFTVSLDSRSIYSRANQGFLTGTWSVGGHPIDIRDEYRFYVKSGGEKYAAVIIEEQERRGPTLRKAEVIFYARAGIREFIVEVIEDDHIFDDTLEPIWVKTNEGVHKPAGYAFHGDSTAYDQWLTVEMKEIEITVTEGKRPVLRE